VGLSTNNLRPLLDFATHLAQLGGQVAMRHYRRADAWKKPDGSFVTRADFEVEEAIVAEILRMDRRAQILGEEYGGARDGLSGEQWVVDPIDGTSWFALGLPIFGVLVALCVDREPILGVIHCPALAETVSAARGLGCWHQVGAAPPVKARVANCESIGKAHISVAGLAATELGSWPEDRRTCIAPLARQCGSLVTAGDCVQHALLATGRLHVAIDPIMRPWDSAAIIPCVREAGGNLGALVEGDVPLAFAGSLISATSAGLLAQVKAALRST
jgi:histidinol-phosphatase